MACREMADGREKDTGRDGVRRGPQGPRPALAGRVWDYGRACGDSGL